MGAKTEPDSPPSRKYELLAGEAVAEGILRIADGRAADAIEHLQRASGEELADGVHEARKSLKKLRSVLRLVRDGLGDELYRRENDRYRDAARALAELRDAGALLETVAALRERFEVELGPAALDPLERALAQLGGGTEPQSAAVERATDLIEEGRGEIGAWPLRGDGFGLLGPGLRRAYARGRRRLGDVIDEPGAVAVHEWRKRVKDLWYMSRILERAWPELIGPMADQAHELASLLGDHHDLAALDERLRETPGLEGPALPAATLGDLIERRRAELLELALPLGRRLYAEPAEGFVKRIGAYWDHGVASRD